MSCEIGRKGYTKIGFEVIITFKFTDKTIQAIEDDQQRSILEALVYKLAE